MKARSVFLIAVSTLTVLALALPSQSQTTQIIVERADATRNISVLDSADLNTLVSHVVPRFVVQYANAMRSYAMPPIPAAFPVQINDRFIIHYANANQEIRLTAYTGPVEVTDRMIVQYANANRQLPMSYPGALIGDTTVPQLGPVMATPTLSGITIVWTTDEFATSAVLYGVQSGVYSPTVNDPLYVKRHEMTLTGLPSGTTYFYKVRSTDRSGNTSTSSEYQFTDQGEVVRSPIFLPLIQRMRR